MSKRNDLKDLLDKYETGYVAMIEELKISKKLGHDSNELERVKEYQDACAHWIKSLTTSFLQNPVR
jgi:hypothetical protein